MKLTDLEKIDVKRKKLITLSKRLNSLTDPELIKFSQELDEMIIVSKKVSK
jgi:hypothetical protein